MITIDWIDEQIKRRRAELEQVLANANRAVGELNGRIAQLEELRAQVEHSRNGVVEHEHEAA